MIDLMTIPGESSLIDEALKSQLSGIFGKMEGQVAIKAIVDLSREKDSQMAAFLNTIAALSPKLELTLYGPEDEDRPMELDASHLPVTGLYKDGAYGRVSFHGIPGGKEMNAFVLAVYNLAGPGQEVPKGVRKKIDRLKKRTNIKVCVSLACHHCAGVVAACQQIAILNPNIEAEMIDAALYEDLIAQYKIERVPMIIFNDKEIHMGGKTIEEILALLKK
ncbi:thioredoxin family protein [Lacrimispora sp. 210928-DFI.3.58]|uniref:thioredoxin family protein n=1 Tax=Lacrimispora sp. 210928-DFI.3.58 TaxID=2883214 RepID=UPI0015B5C272|nr:thioredoxin family protein [Lacrimispora sp. 210928-DFI.3.58]MCB7320504.1 thioredoxin family protein [Lacrimispora sp. 210928-DFI.3.58]